VATIEGMSPERMKMVFEPTDALGHYQVTYTFTREFSGLSNIRHSIVGGFMLNSEHFGQMVIDFDCLLNSGE
jgi:hypothetical protein